MTIETIKRDMLNFRDLYGGDLFDTDAIKNAKTVILIISNEGLVCIHFHNSLDINNIR